ncbi:MAG TPA: reactive intermediate/imine deaminase [Candidatus Atribacteria bacterium]|jgi:2-iminobutanoate/2-iminopropanoate deaminase|nr:reactive intermediate/imine deaminase [Candidatus Atribacteria bacterium]
MEKKIIINSKKIPPAIGPYSPAVKVGKMLFISGQLPIDPEKGDIVRGGIQEQTKQVLENLIALLDMYSVTLKNIVKTTVFLKDMNDFSKFNQIYAEYFKEEFPARSCIEVACLPKDAAVEIEAIAYFPD